LKCLSQKTHNQQGNTDEQQKTGYNGQAPHTGEIAYRQYQQGDGNADEGYADRVLRQETIEPAGIDTGVLGVS
jgi:hypothetical protein